MTCSKVLLGVCGLYCGACYHYRASFTEGRYLLEEAARQGRSLEGFACKGCRSGALYLHAGCSQCKIRACAEDKGLIHCGLCSEFPCDRIEAFQSDGRIHHQDILTHLEELKVKEPDRWLAEQAQRWKCKCGASLSWYEESCHTCDAPLASYGTDPWKQRFRAPVVLWTQLARAAPTRGLAASNRSGTYQLYAWDAPNGQLTPLTNRPEGLLSGLLSPDGRYVYYLDDRRGNEIGHYVRVPFEGGEPQDVTPELPPYATSGLAISQAGNLFGFTLVNPDGSHLCCIDLGPEGAPGRPRMIYRSKRLTYGPVLSHGGEIAVMDSTVRTGTRHYSLLAIDTASGEKIGELWDGPENDVGAVVFSPVAGDLRLLATTNRTGVERPLMWDPRTGERADLALDELEGDVVPLDWSPNGERVLLCQYHHAVQQLYLYDPAGDALTWLDHPAGSFGVLAGLAGLLQEAYFGPQGELLAHWQDATHPPQLIALDGETGMQTRTVLAAGQVPPCRPWQSITFISSDGRAVQGWLSLPDGEGPFPTILHTHGGPAAVITECFSPESQAWLDQGFAYLTINYRSSTTFGRKFQEQIWGHPGHWEVEDMGAARDWLVQAGIARPDQILLAGSSYGGYLTLLALGKRPDLWAGGVASIAIADWAMQYEDAPDTGKGRMAALFGGTPTEKPEQYAASSPITYVENVQAPVLIIQGRNDTRAPARQIVTYEEKMKRLGKFIEVHWFDAGHLGRVAQVERSIEDQERMLRFACRILS